MRQNPAGTFIAMTLAEQATGKPWRKLSRDTQAKWVECASNLIIAMYRAGFTLPQPVDPDAVWDSLHRAMNRS